MTDDQIQQILDSRKFTSLVNDLHESIYYRRQKIKRVKDIAADLDMLTDSERAEFERYKEVINEIIKRKG